jgi:hypothetical protein
MQVCRCEVRGSGLGLSLGTVEGVLRLFIFGWQAGSVSARRAHDPGRNDSQGSRSRKRYQDLVGYKSPGQRRIIR